MSFRQIKSFILKNKLCYFTALLLILGIKYFYNNAGNNELTWILAPTARWVSILSGISFYNDPQAGYVNHSLQAVIAPSCSGVRFLLLTSAALIFSYVHRMKTRRGGFCWIGLCFGFSYLLTVFVNGIRIVLAIYLPLYLQNTMHVNSLLTPERLHTAIGIVVYFSSLFIAYHLAGMVSLRLAKQPVKATDNCCDINDSNRHCDIRDSGSSFKQTFLNCLIPVFWYLFLVLGLPFLNRAYQNNGVEFAEYAVLVASVCLLILCLFLSVIMIRNYFKRKR